MTNPSYFIGKPQPFQNKFFIYPPLVNDVAGNPKFGQYQKILTLSQEEIEDEITEANGGSLEPNIQMPTPLEFLLSNCYHNQTYRELAEEAFYLFIHQKVTILYDLKAILVGDVEESLKTAKTVEDLIIINEDNFFELQNAFRQAIGDKPIDPPDPTLHPKVKRMKALARYRDRVKAKSGNGISLSTSLAAICCMGIGITPLNIGEMSYAAVGTLMQMYQEKEKYDIDIRSLLAGADSKKIQPKYWIRNFDN